MPYCSRCGKQVEETVSFCSNCGAPLKQQSQTPPSSSRMPMFGQYGNRRERLLMIIDKFRGKGAVSPEKAMSAEELGLPPEFKEAMHRRLGQTGIIVETNGKYYLDEKRLEKTRERMASRRFRSW